MTDQTQTPQHIQPEFGVLGELAALMAQCELYKHTSLDDFSQLVLPALVSGQMRVWRRDGLPVAFATWAYLDEAHETDVLHNDARLAVDAWTCGDRPVVMDVVAPFGDGFAIARDLTRTVFDGIAFKAARRDADGSLRKVVQYPGRNADGEWTRARAYAA